MSARPKKSSPKVVPLRPRAAPSALVAVRLGTVTGWSEKSGLLVDYPGSPHGPRPAMTTMRLTAPQIEALIASREAVLLTFDLERPDQPILFGLTQPLPSPSSMRESGPAHAVVDDEVVQLRGNERVELRCGKASIVMTKEGKIVLTGTYISSVSSGAHRIRGGSIEIN
jgi:hypothetical protein